MSPGFRKFALTVHVVSSVGWLGAVAASLAVGVAGLVSQDVQAVRGSYVTLELMGWFVLLPFSLASLLTGLIQALGTRWGLFRHYWVLVKLVMNVVASSVLLMYTRTLAGLADVAADASADLSAMRSPSPVVHAAGALVLLLVAAVLSVYKPRGMTRYGQRKQREERRSALPTLREEQQVPDVAGP